MRFVNIQSDALPNISASIKEQINLGQWLLFKANDNDENVFFYLKTGNDIYPLGEHGEMLASSPIDCVTMREFYYFSDIPTPISLSNACALI